MTFYSSLLDLPAYPGNGYAVLADRLKTLMSSSNDVVFVQAEAILALEAVATSLGRPGRVALNVVTSPYGGLFGDWLRRAGAAVESAVAEDGRPITVEAVQRSLDTLPKVDLVALVHAETSSGILNPLPEIAELVRARGALLVVDAVASVGGHPLDVDALGLDVCVIGPQKALGGPAGLSAVSVSQRAWQIMQPQSAPSSLSLLDLKHNWLDRGRGALPGMPSAIEFWALEAALDRVERESLAATIARHEQAAKATRAGLGALGLELWVGEQAEASTLVTTIVVPQPVALADFVEASRRYGATLSPGFGKIADRVVRFDHTGARAVPNAVIANVVATAMALGEFSIAADLNAALSAIRNVLDA